MKIAVLSNTTMEPLRSHLSDCQIHFSGVGDLSIWLADPDSPAADPTTDLLFVHADGDTLVSPLGGPNAAEDLLDLFENFVKNHPLLQIVVTTLLPGPRSASSYADAADPTGRLATRTRWDLRVSQLAQEFQNVSVLDLQILLNEGSRQSLMTDTYWYLGRIRFSALGFELLGRELDRLVAGTLSRSRKILVLDLDNTLWGGVIGDDGLSGIALSEDGVGKCYRDFQHHLQQLGQSGVLLAVVSKNDASVVDEVFAKHPLMVLRREDFVRVVADWGNKADHIAKLSEDLSLGLDSFVFIDDNAVERSLVRTVLPQVAVPEFPDRPELLSNWFLGDVVPSLFPRANVLDEDRAKTRQYKSRDERRQAQDTNLDEFLKSLDMRITFRIDDESLIHRLSQLTQKTNQFNMSTGTRQSRRGCRMDVRSRHDNSCVRLRRPLRRRRYRGTRGDRPSRSPVAQPFAQLSGTRPRS